MARGDAEWRGDYLGGLYYSILEQTRYHVHLSPVRSSDGGIWTWGRLPKGDTWGASDRPEGGRGMLPREPGTIEGEGTQRQFKWSIRLHRRHYHHHLI